MATFYGQVKGNGKTNATRQGSKMYGTTIWRGGIDGFCKALCGHTFDEMEG